MLDGGNGIHMKVWIPGLSLGRIVAITSDCKSDAFGLRRCESYPRHVYWCISVVG